MAKETQAEKEGQDVSARSFGPVAYGAFMASCGLPVTPESCGDWPGIDDGERANWDAAAQAAITAGAPAELAAAMAETRALTGHLDQATRLMLDLGSNELAASARRIRKAAGLEA